MFFLVFLGFVAVLAIVCTVIVVTDTKKRRAKNYHRVVERKALRNVKLREAEARLERERAAGEA